MPSVVFLRCRPCIEIGRRCVTTAQERIARHLPVWVDNGLPVSLLEASKNKWGGNLARTRHIRSHAATLGLLLRIPFPLPK